MHDQHGPPYAHGRIWLEHEDGTAVLHLAGEIDVATVERYERERTPAVAGDGAGIAGAAVPVVAVDAARVTFLNSTGVAFLVRQTLVARNAGRRPQLRRPSRTAQHVLRLTGVDRLFDVD
jgi:anti-sigma B factor antagonist